MNGLQDWMIEALEAQGYESIEAVENRPSEYGIAQPVIRAEIGGSTYYGVWLDGTARDGSEIEWMDSLEEVQA